MSEATQLAAQLMMHTEQARAAGVHPHDVTQAQLAALMEDTRKADQDRVASLLRAAADALVRR